MKTRLLLASVLVAAAARVQAQTVVVVPCDLDNTLYEDPAGALSNGQGTSIFVGRPSGGLLRRAVLRFNVAGTIPSGAHILAASLSFNVFNSPAGAALDVTGHRVMEAWGEGPSAATSGGGGQGVPAQAGDATWIHRIYPGLFWATVGGTFEPAASFTMTTPQTGLATSPSTAQFVTNVQHWLDHPTQNFGLLLKMVNETLSPSARRIDSRESTGVRPSLSVTYVMAPVGTYGSGCPVGAATFACAFIGVPAGGSTMQITQANGPAPGIGANFFSLELNPAGITLFPSCSLYLSGMLVAGNTFLLDGTGSATSPFAVPQGFPGYLIFTQSAALANSPIGVVASNAAFIRLQ
ncbi:MAG TPA: DNRLRE domain-containing protein [Planctomycetota bacterium]